MREYLKGIVRDKLELTERERKILTDTGNLPVLNKAHTVLSPIAEMMVKLIYLTGGMFLSDMKKLFSLMGLGVKKDDTVRVQISGSDEDEATAVIEKFFRDNL